MADSKWYKLRLEKELYCKKAVIMTIYDWVDQAPIKFSSEGAHWVLEIKKAPTFSEAALLHDLNVNNARELVEERTGNMRDAIYTAALTRFN